jgi:hypothetical protein
MLPSTKDLGWFVTSQHLDALVLPHMVFSYAPLISVLVLSVQYFSSCLNLLAFAYVQCKSKKLEWVEWYSFLLYVEI